MLLRDGVPIRGAQVEVLLDAGLVSVERRGRERVYKLDTERLHAVAGEWLRWFDESKKKEEK